MSGFIACHYIYIHIFINCKYLGIEYILLNVYIFWCNFSYYKVKLFLLIKFGLFICPPLWP